MIKALQSVFPYLDYISRINLNIVLSPDKRINKSLNLNVIKQIELLLNVANLKKGIHMIDSLRGEARKDAFLNYFQHILPKNLLICQHNMKFRAAVIEKVQFYKDLHCPEYVNADDSLMDGLIPLCKEILYKINTKYSYLYSLELPTHDENWSPIDYCPAATIEGKKVLKVVKKKKF